MNELPDGWARATVGDLGEYINGLAFKPSDWTSDGLPIIRIQNLTSAAATYNYTTQTVDARFIVVPGDLLVSWSATLDVFMWGGQRAVLNQHIFKVVPNLEVVDRGFVYWLLKHAIREMTASEHLHGSTMTHINRGPFLAHEVRLPPLAEQARIVAKIDELSAHSRRARDELDAIPERLDQLRQSILAAAFRGDLTADWRADNPGVEPAEQLLGRIHAQRRARWGKGKYQEPLALTDEARVELPPGWAWVTMDAVVAESKIGLVRSRSEQGDTGVPYVRMQHFDADGRWPFRDLTRVAVSPAEAQEYSLVEGDILFNTRNSAVLVGKVGLWSDRLGEPAVYNNNLMRLRPVETVRPAWLAWAMSSPNFVRGLRLAASATTSVAAIYGRDLFRQPVCVAPPAEQTEICARIGATLATAERMLAATVDSLTRVSSLDASILAKALGGELVPQDPNDEPASLALERVRAARDYP
jgi:type I restriction enzyme S subunit